MKIGLERAQTGSLITLGVEPTRPETGYGYIETNGDRNLGYLKVNSFTKNLAKIRQSSSFRKVTIFGIRVFMFVMLKTF